MGRGLIAPREATSRGGGTYRHRHRDAAGVAFSAVAAGSWAFRKPQPAGHEICWRFLGFPVLHDGHGGLGGKGCGQPGEHRD